MALIKHAAASTLPRDAIVLNLAELSEQAAQITRVAHERAASIVAQAEAERRRLLDTATAEGFAAGQKAGMEKGLADGRAKGVEEARAERAAALATLEKEWGVALDRFDQTRETMLMHARADVLTLALGVARRVTKRVVETDPKVVESQLAAVLELITRPSRLTLRVHPDDVEAAKVEAKGLSTRIAGARHAEVVADPGVTRGSVMASSDRGSIDASIETQLDRIVEALLPGASHAAPASAPEAAAPEAPAPPPADPEPAP